MKLKDAEAKLDRQSVPPGPGLRKRLMVAGMLFLVTAAVLVAGVKLRVEPALREFVVDALEERFASDLELTRLSVSLFPAIRVTGEELVFRHHGRTDVPPLISLKKFSADVGLLGLLSTPKRVRKVRLEGLQIHVARRREGQDKNQDKPEERDEPETKTPNDKERSPAFVIAEIDADGALLRVLPKKAGKFPLTFDISRLSLHSVGVDRPMSFRATLTNAKPPGLIESTGEFGTWQKEEPGLTPVSGSYTFENADLSVFRGISGILSSEGKYQGVLERIEVTGTTDTPDFTVGISGNPVHLKTEFNALVDGTDGDTFLEPVNAEFLCSGVIARGGVTGTPGVKGKTVSLDVTVSDARVEDLIRLAVKSAKPVLTGKVSFRTKFELPPGEEDIADKLYLNGRFGIEKAQFTSANVQRTVETLSRRGRGQTDDDDSESESTVANLNGQFVLNDAIVTFSHLSFDVPGASVRLDGTYGLRSEELDFRGELRLQAKLSETTTGIKSFLLKAVDPFFKKDGAGAVLPIKITGTREHASFGLNLGGSSRPKE